MTDAIAVALIAAVPASIAAISGIRTARRVKTPNGSTLGALAESTHDRLTEHLDAPMGKAHPREP